MHGIGEKMPLEAARVLIVGPGAGLFERLTTTASGAAKVTPSYLLEHRATEVEFVGDLVLQVEDENGAVRQLGARRVTVTRRGDREKKDELVGAWQSQGPFDLCICELDFDALTPLGDLLASLGLYIGCNGRIVV